MTTKPPPRHFLRVVTVARGNFRKGYQGLVRVDYVEGPPWYPLSACPHRHRFTRTARACAKRQWSHHVLLSAALHHRP